jgi:hypothetical protein
LSLFNPARGEVLASLGGREVRLCVTLRALAMLERHFGVTGLEALGERLKSLSAADLSVVLTALCMEDISTLDIGFQEALHAVVAAFGALERIPKREFDEVKSVQRFSDSNERASI